MSLAFLAKKSWHTANLRNVEKVWLAEQRTKEEQRKLAELQKQIQEERQIQELRELQIRAGNKMSTQERLDWMYEGPAAAAKQSSEEYLLGKEYKGESVRESVELKKEPGALWLNKITPKNDLFTRVHEDPLLQIKMSEKQARESIIKNPVKMQRITHQLQAELEEKKRRKEEKKRLKKEKKRRKRKSRSRSRSSSAPHSRSQSRSRSRSRDRSRSRSRDRRRRRARDESVSRSRSKSRSRTRDRVRERDDDRSRSDRARDRSRERSDRHRRRSRDRRESPESKTESRASRESAAVREEARQTDSRYGLVANNSRRTQEENNSAPTHLGPNPELLRQREEQERKERERLQSQRRRTVLTEEEKQQRLLEMQSDAVVNETIKTARLLQPRKGREAEEESRHASDPKFLREMASNVYADGNMSMTERIQRNKHYHQSGNDLENSFLDR